MAKTPKASSYAMFPAHVRVKSPQDQVDAGITRTCIVCHEITDPATDPVVIKYM
jgi:NADH pyrophosphatase NudC (nudix superfamily)